MKAKIAVLDYGIGNIRSVIKALEFLGAEVTFTSSFNKINRCKGLVLPGVSSFGACIDKLEKDNMKEKLISYLTSKKPYLGICLGYQILFEESEEAPGKKGLSIFGGTVKKFSNNLKIPHMGWNSVKINRHGSRMFQGIKNNSYFYFVHSYYPVPQNKEIISGVTEYGLSFASSICYENIWACQFHPEKSSNKGLHILNNFCRWCEES